MQHPADASAELTLPGDKAEQYDIAADRKHMTDTLVGSEEVDALVSTLSVDDLAGIVTFGADTANEISKVSDAVLKSVNMPQLDQSNEMMAMLARIMEKFDMNELRGNASPLSRLLGSARRQLDKVLAKYHTLGDEVDKIYVLLRQYETEIRESNRHLEELFEANVGYYRRLVKYILAGEQGCREIEAYIAQREKDYAATHDQTIQFELQSLRQALDMLSQRTHDLRLAENVAMQSIPMLKIMQMNNMNLVRKINSSFIVTLPVFKQALAQAILLKRQSLQTEALNALDKRTNELLLRNAQETARQAILAARMSAEGPVSPDTLESAFRTIVGGIEETKKLRAEAKRQQADSRALLEQARAGLTLSGNEGKK